MYISSKIIVHLIQGKVHLIQVHCTPCPRLTMPSLSSRPPSSIKTSQTGLKVLQQSTLLLVFVFLYKKCQFSPICTLYPTAAYTQMGSAGSPTAARPKTNRLRIVYKQIYYTSMVERFKIHKELKHLPHIY